MRFAKYTFTDTWIANAYGTFRSTESRSYYGAVRCAIMAFIFQVPALLAQLRDVLLHSRVHILFLFNGVIAQQGLLLIQRKLCGAYGNIVHLHFCATEN